LTTDPITVDLLPTTDGRRARFFSDPGWDWDSGLAHGRSLTCPIPRRWKFRPAILSEEPLGTVLDSCLRWAT